MSGAFFKTSFTVKMSIKKKKKNGKARGFNIRRNEQKNSLKPKLLFAINNEIDLI